MPPTLPTLQSLSTMYVFRVLHIGSMIGLGYKIINDYINGEISTQHSTLFALIGVTVMISGTFSIIKRLCEHIFITAEEDG